MKATKTKTAVSVALTVLAAGSILAGIYYYGNRNSLGGQAASSCNVDYDRIKSIVETAVAKINTGGGSGSGSGATSSTGGFTGGCMLNVPNISGPAWGVCGPTYSKFELGKERTMTGFWQCDISTSELWGKGCQALSKGSKDLDLGQTEVSKSGNGEGHNVKYQCSQIAEPGYACVATQKMQASSVCSCTKK